MIVIVMGVSGSGKSTIARELARIANLEYVDADDFHSAQNIAKMQAGMPLTDADRIPWLQSMRTAITDWIAAGRNVTLACSALKQSYRDILMVDPKEQRLVYLRGSFELFRKRLLDRAGHFMKEPMLKSQFETLEEPLEHDAIICDANESVEQILSLIIASIHPSQQIATTWERRLPAGTDEEIPQGSDL